MKNILMIMMFSLLLAAAPLLAAEKAACDDNHVAVKVNGLVCDFCARALEKTFGKRDEVEKITVDLNNGNVGITLKPGQKLEDGVIRQTIKDAGYDVTGIQRGC